MLIPLHAKPPAFDINNRGIENPTAYVSSQCYTKTIDEAGNKHNPCFTCHRKSVEPNFTYDYWVQEVYDFPEEARVNPFTNLFKDRTEAIAKISDDEILRYVRKSNYFDEQGRITLAERLSKLPENWDYDQDGKWDGYVPDCYFNFDSEGFDHAPDGSHTGWRAFAYYPFPGTFWPTNGSTDDVLIRLGEPFRQNEKGEFDLDVYKLNLAIVEALIQRKDITIPKTDEKRYGVDLDKDGVLGVATKIRYDWAPLQKKFMYYVGQAKALQDKGELHLAAGLYPEKTEFLHTVRYIDVKDDGIAMAPRMKELRYGVKKFWVDYWTLQFTDMKAGRGKREEPDDHDVFLGDAERGLDNGRGWRYMGFLEDYDGELRPSNNEETLFCLGCHGNMGATTDTTFVFQRKLDHRSFQGGWYHWSQKGLKGMKEPRRKDGQLEYAHYLRQNHAGDEFRENREVMEKFFDQNGTLKKTQLQALKDDITTLIFPSKERALQLNKAYRIIVQEQSFIYGRDATITPVQNVHREVEDQQPTGLKAIDTLYGVFSR